jgi:TolA-binding protein
VKKIKIKGEEKKIIGKEFNAVEYFNLNKTRILCLAASVIIAVLLVGAFVIWQGSQETNVSSLIIQAKELFYNGKYEDALGVYKEFVKKYSKNKLVPAAYLGIAYCNEQMKNLEEAKIGYLNVQKNYPDSPWAEEALRGFGRLS